MQEEKVKPKAFAHLSDIDSKAFAGRRGFPVENIGNVLPGFEITSTSGDSMVAFILQEDENDIYVFMPAEVKLEEEEDGAKMNLAPYGFSPILRVNRRSVQDVTPIFYEKEWCYYGFALSYVLDILPETMHPGLSKWLVYLTERVQAAKTASKRSIYKDEVEAREEQEAGIIPHGKLSQDELDLIVEHMHAEFGEDVEIHFADSVEEFERKAGIEDGSLDMYEQTGQQPKKKIVH